MPSVEIFEVVTFVLFLFLLLRIGLLFGVIKKYNSSTEQYHQESLDIAQRLSQRWQTLRENVKENPHFLSGFPKLEEINDLSKPPLPGIRRWFEGQVDSINEHSRPGVDRSRMMYRLKEDLENIEKQFDSLI